jgi:hypothetical protein
LSLASEANRAFVAFHLGLFRVFVALHLGLFKALVCSPSPSVSTVAKIAQFGKRMRKIWGVQWKGVQCSTMSELKHIKIYSLRSFIFAFGI